MADLVLVDNDERIVELVAWFLRRARHTVRTAASYARVRGLLAERMPDLMLADLELGEERGDEELPRLAAEGLLPPTLVVSGYLDRGSEAALRRVPGVLGTLGKPFDLAALERTIAECLAMAPAPPGVEGPGPAADPGPDSSPEPLEDDEGWMEIVFDEKQDPRASGGDLGWVVLEQERP